MKKMVVYIGHERLRAFPLGVLCHYLLYYLHTRKLLDVVCQATAGSETTGHLGFSEQRLGARYYWHRHLVLML
jgi:hypothetical protein